MKCNTHLDHTTHFGQVAATVNFGSPVRIPTRSARSMASWRGARHIRMLQRCWVMGWVFLMLTSSYKRCRMDTSRGNYDKVQDICRNSVVLGDHRGCRGSFNGKCHCARGGI